MYREHAVCVRLSRGVAGRLQAETPIKRHPGVVGVIVGEVLSDPVARIIDQLRPALPIPGYAFFPVFLVCQRDDGMKAPPRLKGTRRIRSHTWPVGAQGRADTRIFCKRAGHLVSHK
ncbi:hypothetical protein D3C81_1548910 [compost metagenome]